MVVSDMIAYKDTLFTIDIVRDTWSARCVASPQETVASLQEESAESGCRLPEDLFEPRDFSLFL